MKNSFKVLIISFLLIFAYSCKDNEETIGCLEMYVPLAAHISYLDNNGNNLLFGKNPTFPVENIKIYSKEDEKQTPLIFKANKEAKIISVYIDKKETGTFYIELKPNVVDKVIYKTKVDTNDPCNDILLTEVKQNDMTSPYDDKSQSWLFKK